eukprot:gene11002-3074_t
MSVVQTFTSHEGQNSSRVLAPPGGRSTFSFCDGSTDSTTTRKAISASTAAFCHPHEYKPAPVTEKAMPSQAHAPQQPLVQNGRYKYNQHHRSQITFGTEDVPPQPAAVTQRHIQQQPSCIQHTTSKVPLRAQNMREANTFDIKVQAGKHRQDVHTSSRVLAPPGGHTHNIFG